MNNIKHSGNESKVTNAIFNAVRANEARETKNTVSCLVEFMPATLDGVRGHVALVSDNDGLLIGSAFVDEYDN